MASWNAPTIYSTGNTLSLTAYNNLANDATFLYEAPYGFAYASTATSVPNESLTQVTIDTTLASNYSFGLTSNNLVVPLAGTYFVTGQTAFNNDGGNFSAQIYHNGSPVAGNNSFSENTSCGIRCSASDTIGLWAYQNSGSSINTITGSANTYLHAFFIGSS